MYRMVIIPSVDRVLKRRNPSGRDRLPAGTVLIVSPGGLEHNGGIGRQMGYFLRAQSATPGKVHYQIVDPRGPWYIGDSPLYLGFAMLYLTGAVFSLIKARISSARCLAHINIAGRGSTIRKIILVMVARALRMRYLLHVHDPDYAGDYYSRGKFFKTLVASAFRRAAAIVVLGKRDQAVISQLFQMSNDRVIILYNAVPDPMLDVDTKHSVKPPHLLFLGRLSARKGVPELLRALGSPSMTSLSWSATLAGDGPLGEFRQLADDLGVRGRVCFPGWIDESGVGRLCADADVLVLPSHGEGLAMSVLEGLAHGLAVVTTPVGAHCEVIEPEVSGIFVPPGDVPALASALARVIDDESLRRRLGRGARERFLKEFDVRRYACRLGRLHSDLLAYGVPKRGLIGKGQRF
jgi:glycosyltransferase involved in cell wall biosynthesis